MTFAIATSPSDEALIIDSALSFDDSSWDQRSAALSRTQVAGRFSLVDHDPVAIDAVPGLVVRVHSGSLWATQIAPARRRLVRAGEHFVAAHPGRLILRASERGELALEWPES